MMDRTVSKDEVDMEKSRAHLEEAAQVIEIDSFRVLGLDADDADFYKSFSPERRKKVFRKVRETRDASPSSVAQECH